MFLKLFMLLGFLLVFILATSQVVIPLWFNRPTFPMFRGKRRKLESDLAKAQDAVDQKELKIHVKDLKQQAR